MSEPAMSIDERVAKQLVEDDWRQAQMIASGYTPPPNARPVSEARDLELWDQTDPTFDEGAAWREHIAAGTDLWVAKTDIATRKYPNRKGMIQQGRPRVKEQIAYAEAMAAKSARARVKREDDAARVRDYPAAPLPPFEATPGPVPLPLPRAAQQPPPEPVVVQPQPTLPNQPMTGPGLPEPSPETGY